MEGYMQLHSDIKPISWIKSNAKQMVESVAETGNPMVITQNGEAKAVVMNVREYDQMRQSLAILRLLANSSADVAAGKLRDSSEVFADMCRMIAEKRTASQAVREVHIHVVEDGRRNFTELLQERLLNIPPDASTGK
jgi:prevent-host-death family protein